MFDLAYDHQSLSDLTDFELVLSHCFEKIGNEDYSQALAYGRKSGYLNTENKLTVSDRAFAQFAQFDLETAA